MPWKKSAAVYHWHKDGKKCCWTARLSDQRGGHTARTEWLHKWSAFQQILLKFRIVSFIQEQDVFFWKTAPDLTCPPLSSINKYLLIKHLMVVSVSLHPISKYGSNMTETLNSSLFSNLPLGPYFEGQLCPWKSKPVLTHCCPCVSDSTWRTSYDHISMFNDCVYVFLSVCGKSFQHLGHFRLCVLPPHLRSCSCLWP